MLSFFALVSCSTPPTYNYFRTGEVTCVKNDARLVTVTSTYNAGTVSQAQLFAERNAIENLLFKGIHNCYEVPIVEDESVSISSHKSFYDWLIHQKEYERYITDRALESSKSSKDVVFVRETITFDVLALRKEMEKQGVIKKFGL